ncbi:hypothetical protein HN385_04125 [archaeon]|nr:hypothetical protein [archaeon]MBT3451674.1 hypothetical protein [archaeon]MBT6869118.1 hypothetical protein [archaeon]MBT7193361.1 hypothetical protein [archaeon]MBT7380369.1 hypothetical protein [archaeon]
MAEWDSVAEEFSCTYSVNSDLCNSAVNSIACEYDSEGPEITLTGPESNPAEGNFHLITSGSIDCVADNVYDNFEFNTAGASNCAGGSPDGGCSPGAGEDFVSCSEDCSVLGPFFNNFNDNVPDHSFFGYNNGYGVVTEENNQIRMIGVSTASNHFMATYTKYNLTASVPSRVSVDVVDNTGFESLLGPGFYAAKIVFGMNTGNTLNCGISMTDQGQAQILVNENGGENSAVDISTTNVTLIADYNSVTKHFTCGADGQEATISVNALPTSYLTLWVDGLTDTPMDISFDNLNYTTFEEISCADDNDCPSSRFADCNVGSGYCEQCGNDGDCTHIDGKPTCDAGTCISGGGGDNAGCTSAGTPNGVCEVGPGETSSNCVADCGGIPECGNDVCAGAETSENCPYDCSGGPATLTDFNYEFTGTSLNPIFFSDDSGGINIVQNDFINMSGTATGINAPAITSNNLMDNNLDWAGSIDYSVSSTPLPGGFITANIGFAGNECQIKQDDQGDCSLVNGGQEIPAVACSSTLEIGFTSSSNSLICTVGQSTLDRVIGDGSNAPHYISVGNLANGDVVDSVVFDNWIFAYVVGGGESSCAGGSPDGMCTVNDENPTTCPEDCIPITGTIFNSFNSELGPDFVFNQGGGWATGTVVNGKYLIEGNSSAINHMAVLATTKILPDQNSEFSVDITDHIGDVGAVNGVTFWVGRNTGTGHNIDCSITTDQFNDNILSVNQQNGESDMTSVSTNFGKLSGYYNPFIKVYSCSFDGQTVSIPITNGSFPLGTFDVYGFAAEGVYFNKSLDNLNITILPDHPCGNDIDCITSQFPICNAGTCVEDVAPSTLTDPFSDTCDGDGDVNAGVYSVFASNGMTNPVRVNGKVLFNGDANQSGAQSSMITDLPVASLTGNDLRFVAEVDFTSSNNNSDYYVGFIEAGSLRVGCSGDANSLYAYSVDGVTGAPLENQITGTATITGTWSSETGMTCNINDGVNPPTGFGQGYPSVGGVGAHKLGVILESNAAGAVNFKLDSLSARTISCIFDNHCTDANAGKCNIDGVCVPCTEISSQCGGVAGGLNSCKVSNGVCVDCVDNAGCTGEETCIDNSCIAPGGATPQNNLYDAFDGTVINARWNSFAGGGGSGITLSQNDQINIQGTQSGDEYYTGIRTTDEIQNSGWYTNFTYVRSVNTGELKVGHGAASGTGFYVTLVDASVFSVCGDNECTNVNGATPASGIVKMTYDAANKRLYAQINDGDVTMHQAVNSLIPGPLEIAFFGGANGDNHGWSIDNLNFLNSFQELGGQGGAPGCMENFNDNLGTQDGGVWEEFETGLAGSFDSELSVIGTNNGSTSYIYRTKNNLAGGCEKSLNLTHFNNQGNSYLEIGQEGPNGFGCRVFSNDYCVYDAEGQVCAGHAPALEGIMGELMMTVKSDGTIQCRPSATSAVIQKTASQINDGKLYMKIIENGNPGDPIDWDLTGFKLYNMVDLGGQGGGCVGDNDCSGATPLCRGDPGACVQCELNGDCGTQGLTCNVGTCASAGGSCANINECTNPNWADCTQYGLCGSCQNDGECQANSNFGAGYVCNQGTCEEEGGGYQTETALEEFNDNTFEEWTYNGVVDVAGGVLNPGNGDWIITNNPIGTTETNTLIGELFVSDWGAWNGASGALDFAYDTFDGGSNGCNIGASSFQGDGYCTLSGFYNDGADNGAPSEFYCAGKTVTLTQEWDGTDTFTCTATVDGADYVLTGTENNVGGAGGVGFQLFGIGVTLDNIQFTTGAGDSATCGNFLCEASKGENANDCPADCSMVPECGNTWCQPDLGEFEGNCDDCMATWWESNWCGDGICTGGEESFCPVDCNGGGMEEGCFQYDSWNGGDQSTCEAANCMWNAMAGSSSEGWCDPDWDNSISCSEACWACETNVSCSQSNKNCDWWYDSWMDESFCVEDFNADHQAAFWDPAGGITHNEFGKSIGDGYDFFPCKENIEFCDSTWNTAGGYVEMEFSCYDGKDNDQDTKSDCEDPDCYSDFNCIDEYALIMGSDNTTPSIKNINIDPWSTGFFVDIMFSKPVGINATFWDSDPTCSGTADNVIEPWDDPFSDWDNYMLFRGIPFDGYSDSLGSDLSPNTTHGYKITFWDQAGNTVTSKCKNATTTSVDSDYNWDFGFDDYENSEFQMMFDYGLGAGFEDIGGSSMQKGMMQDVTMYIPPPPGKSGSVSVSNLNLIGGGQFDANTAYMGFESDEAFIKKPFVGFNSSFWSDFSQSATPDSNANITLTINVSSLGQTPEQVVADNKVQKCSDAGVLTGDCVTVDSSLTTLAVAGVDTITLTMPISAGFSVYTTGVNSQMNITDDTDSVTKNPGDSINFYANYTKTLDNSTLTPGANNASCNISSSQISVSNTVMTFNSTGDGRWNYTTTSFGAAGNYDWEVNCTATGFDLLNATDTVTITAAEGGEEVPEFSDYAIALLLMTVAGGFVYMRKNEVAEES